MATQLLSGTPIATAMRQRQAERVKATGVTPRLAIIQAGDDLASTTYIGMKQRYGATIGVEVAYRRVGDSAEELINLINQLNRDSTCHAIDIQLPLPDPTITDSVTAAIAPTKDIDGLGPHSAFISATAEAIMTVLDHYHVQLEGTPVALIGQGRLVGQPLTKLLQDRGARLSVATKATADLAAVTRPAHIVISATGAGGLITPDMISDHTTVIDVGTAEGDGAIVGDVDPAVFANLTLTTTPPKGGIGPVTVATLFEHVLQAAGV